MAINSPNEFMNNSYNDLVKQTFNYPQEDFESKDDYLFWNGLDMKSLIEKVAASVPFSLEEIDISADAHLEQLYGLEIPVLMVDGKKAAK